MILSKDDFISRISERLGEDNSDETLTFIEDVTDTLNDYEERLSSTDNEDWKSKYDELDASWRKRYRERFFKPETTPEEVKDEQEKDVKEDPNEDVTFDELFEEREGD